MLVSANSIPQRHPAMSAHASIFDQFAQDQRAPIKQKWRDKLFSNEGKTKKLAASEKSEQDVDEFLRPSSSRSNPKPSLDLSVPRIDVSNASRWPSAVEVSQVNPPKLSSPQRKPPRREGLHVAFISAAPDIIGEGGDEAELPAIAVSRSRGPLASYQPFPSNSPEQGSRIEPFAGDERQPAFPKSSPVRNDDPHRPMTLQRRPTGLADISVDDSPDDDVRDLNSMRFDDSVSLSNTYAQSSNLPHEPRNTDVNHLETIQQGRYGDPAQQNANFQALPHDKLDYPVELTKLLVPPLDLGLSLSNSLTPIPSPSPPTQLLNPSFPKLTGNSLKPEYFQLSSEQTSEKSPRASPQPEIEGPKPSSGSRLLTIRSLAKNFGDDALHEFSSSVERFYGIFQLGATATSPLMEISFAQWIRVAAFWFLKGRGKLEAAVRVNGRSPTETDHAGSRDISRDLGQAYLDLAKAWWVVEKIIPVHPEPKRFGNAGMSTLIAITASFGEKNLAEQIGVHLAIIANMRALVMSMKRNNRLPTSAFDIRGLDTRIFVKYPVLASGVASLFSNHSRSLIVDGSRGDEPFLAFMVGDTKRHFLYSTSFVDIILAASSDAHDQITFHCALFVLRERAARELKVVIASQDGQINLVIQSSGKDGLTWEEVEWNIKTHTLILKLSEAVNVQVQVPEKDFKTLWGIHDYTRTIHKGLQCGQGEREVFSVELPVFQNLDPGSSKLFPTDPVKNCLLRLFEKKRSISEAIRGLQRYDGHRLVVVTPSDMKTLSSINLECGKEKPVLFSFLRDDGSAPALLLKFSKPTSISSMVMTFAETEARGLFHSLLNGTSISVTESCSQPLPLKTFAISPLQSDASGSARAQNFLNDVHWLQLRVIENNAKSPTQVVSRSVEHLRIWIEAEVGSFVDYMNLGKPIGS